MIEGSPLYIFWSRELGLRFPDLDLVAERAAAQLSGSVSPLVAVAREMERELEGLEPEEAESRVQTHLRALAALGSVSRRPLLSSVALVALSYGGARANYARYQLMPAWRLREMARMPERWVRAEVARNHRCPEDVLLELSRDPDHEVVAAARSELRRRAAPHSAEWAMAR